MRHYLINQIKRIVGLSLLSFPCVLFAQEKTPEWAYGYPEETIRGIRYFQLSNTIDHIVQYPSLESLRAFGFMLNPDDEETYIAPDGKIIPKFYSALWAEAPNQNNPGMHTPEDALPYYVGDIYLPDFIEGFHSQSDPYVLGFNWTAIGDKVTSIRTPLYMPVTTGCFQHASNLKKVQIGACYAVDPCSFWYCRQLETVIIEKDPFIYRYAFAGCPDIKSVVLKSGEDLPAFEDTSAFEESVYENATLYLPDSLMEKCGSDPLWSKFVHKKSLKECPVEPVKR